MTSQLTRNAIVILALLAAGFFGAWLRFKDHLGVSGVYSDGAHEWRPVQEGGDLRYAVWGTPRELSGLNGGGAEGCPAASPDGRVVVFSVGERGLNTDLFVADVRGSDSFGPARSLDAINGARDEVAPAFADGFLYFASDREGGVGGLDLWRAPYADGVFGAAEWVGGGVNTSAEETDPTPRGVGTSLVFASDRPGGTGGFDLYRAAPAPVESGAGDGVVVALDSLNSAADEREAAWSDGGRTLFFASDRPGHGGFDLYKSAWHGGEWLSPIAIEGLNTEASERGPVPSADGFSLFFSRAEAEVPADLYRVRSIELYRLPGRPVGWFDLALLAALCLLALLAWLARRWPQLDILWKCLLVSLLAHLGLVWLMRYLYVEPEVYELPGDDRRIRVRLLDDSSRLASLRERGGVLEVAREEVAGERLDRRAIETPRSEIAEPAPREAVTFEERWSDPAREEGPERVPSVVAAGAPEPRAAAELRDAPEPTEKQGGAAVSLAVTVEQVALDRSSSLANAERVQTPVSPTESSAPPLETQAPTATFALLPSTVPTQTGADLERRSVAAQPAFRPQVATVVLDDKPGDAPTVAREEPDSGARVPAADLAQSLLDARRLERPPTVANAPEGPRRWNADAGALPDARPEARAVTIAAREETLDKSPAARWSQTPYQSRSGARKERAIEEYGGSEETERAVRGGLAYLASVQHPLGNWGRANARDDKYGQVAIGKTALCLLAFLGAGHTHESETEYSETVRSALTFLLGSQGRGGHFGAGSAYGHGIATYAVAECYALTQDEALRPPLERAVDQILRHQDRRPDRRMFGGWSYYYASDRTFDEWPRVSISAWQVMALESARLGGLPVPDFAFEDAREFFANAQDSRQPWFRYCHDPDRLRSGYPTLPASTPAALFALSLLGEDIGGREHSRTLAFVVDRSPNGYRFTSDDDFVYRAQGNLYFWYYGTLAMFRVGGGAWETWNEAMKRTLVPAQEADGSWRPIDIYAQRFAGDTERDRSYSTALCVLSLEIYYRYFLPLLKVR